MLHEDLNYPWRLDEISGLSRRYSKLATAATFANRVRFKILGGYTADFVGSWATIFGAHYGIGVEVEPGLWGAALHNIAVTDPAASGADSFVCFNLPQDLLPSGQSGAFDLEGMKSQFTAFTERVIGSGKELVFVLYDTAGFPLPGMDPGNTLSAAIAALNLHMISLSTGRHNVRVLDVSVLRSALPSTPFYDHRNWY